MAKLYYCLKKCFVGNTLCHKSEKANSFQLYRFPDNFDFGGLMPIGNARYNADGTPKEEFIVIDSKTNKPKLDASGDPVLWDYTPCFQLAEGQVPTFTPPPVQRSGPQLPPVAPTIDGRPVVGAGRGPGGMRMEDEVASDGIITPVGLGIQPEAVEVSESFEGVNTGPRDPDGPGYRPRASVPRAGGTVIPEAAEV